METNKIYQPTTAVIEDYSSPWFEFENNFEEGWGGDPSIYRLANHSHHREVANFAANELAKKYPGESFFKEKDWESLAQEAYNSAAKKLYPEEKLWSGDNYENPAFLARTYLLFQIQKGSH